LLMSFVWPRLTPLLFSGSSPWLSKISLQPSQVNLPFPSCGCV
jgi:hypothetical protein